MKNQIKNPEKTLPFIPTSGTNTPDGDTRSDENERRISELNERLAEYMLAVKLWRI